LPPGRQAIDQPIRNRIGGGIREHDGDRLGSLLGGQAVVWTTRNDDIDLETNQIFRQSGDPLEFIFSVAKLVNDVLAFDVTELTQLSSKCFGAERGTRSSPAQSSNAVNFPGRLRLSYDRNSEQYCCNRD
jgi:hypothetical protein